tara:strand:+ start:5925 stop:7529 length:1605 start_codon:yes stop_codon:yes gene_type:complete
MNDEILLRQIDDLINGTISETAHQELQDRLKSDAASRTIFRERMDIEAGLRTLVADGDVNQQPAFNKTCSSKRPLRMWSRLNVMMLVTAFSLLMFVFWWTQRLDRTRPELAKQAAQTAPPQLQLAATSLGQVVAQLGCVWQQAPLLEKGRFLPGIIKLTSGAAELRFDSGTNITLEGPCEVIVEAVDSTRLVAGTVFVDVTEVSNGFLLETPDAQIIDEGTEYAVTLDSQATEVHVFDGSVIWTTAESDLDFEERIPSGEARRYLYSEPGRSHRIPFGRRQFVRRIEEAVREAGSGDLIAYDGFENLAGRLRRGRSGFGWNGGWEPAGRTRRSLAEIIDAPNDEVFGLSRADRRLLLLSGGDSLRRRFEKSIQLGSGQSIFVSILISRHASSNEDNSSTQIVLEPEAGSRRYMRRHSVSFGVTSKGEPFLNNAGKVSHVTIPLVEADTYLFVLKFDAEKKGGNAMLRIYSPDSTVDLNEPDTWSVASRSSDSIPDFKAIRITTGKSRDWEIDELKVGSSWSAVVAEAADIETDR